MVKLDLSQLPAGYKVATVEASRGCPYSCEFCSLSKFNGSAYRPRRVDHVVDEINSMKQRMFVFADANFFGGTAEQIDGKRELLRELARRKTGKLWAASSSITVADRDDILELAHAAGCRIILIGFESLSLGALRTIRKPANTKYIGHHREYTRAIRNIHRHGMAVYGSFIYGTDDDDPDALEHLETFCRSSKLDILEVCCLTPLPGTRLFDRLEKADRLLETRYPRDWERYTNDRIVFKPKDTSVFEFCLRYAAGMRRLLNLFTWRHLSTLRTTRSPVVALAVMAINRSYAKRMRTLLAI